MQYEWGTILNAIVFTVCSYVGKCFISEALQKKLNLKKKRK